MTDPRTRLREALAATLEAVWEDLSNGVPSTLDEADAVLARLADEGWGPTAAHKACVKRLRDDWKPCKMHADMWTDRLLVKHEPMTPAEQEVMSRG